MAIEQGGESSPPKNNEKKQYLTMKELAAYLRISRNTIWKHVQAGDFPVTKAGIRVLFDLAAVNAWLEKQTKIGPEESENRKSKTGRRDKNKPVVFSLN
jgi:excisionase family DNA binding protein